MSMKIRPLMTCIEFYKYRPTDIVGTSVKQGAECFVYWKDATTQQFWGLNFISAADARRFRNCCTLPVRRVCVCVCVCESTIAYLGVDRIDIAYVISFVRFAA